MATDRRTGIIAGNFQQFVDWRQGRMGTYVYLNKPEKILFLSHGTRVLSVGTAYERKDYGQFLEEAENRGITPTWGYTETMEF